MKMSKKMLSIVLALVMAITCVIPVFADTYATSGTCGENVTWEFDVATRTLTISGEGEMYSGSPWSTYKEIIKTVIIEDGVTSIEGDAFYDHSALTSITVPDSVTSIGREAFAYCESLNSISLPDGITSIASGVFYGCTSLASVVIPDSVTYIDDYAFRNCVALTDVVIPDSVKTIHYDCFVGCSSLKNVTIGKGVSSIHSSAFSVCPALENVYISDLSSWCKIAFDSNDSNPLYYAENLYLNGELVTDLVIPENIASIEDYAFCNYNKLERVTIHKDVNLISETAFRDCNSLAEINVDENNETFKSIDGVLFSNNMIALLKYPEGKKDEAYVIPNNVLIIKDYAFQKNVYLKTVTIPETVATIGEYTFYGCLSLTSLTIPSDVVSIGMEAFSKCHKLNTVVMGSGITSIGSSAFGNVDDLYYNGTEEQWNAVSVGRYNYFERIHYNCINPEGHYTLTKVVEPTSCSKAGYSVYTCPCGYTMEKDYTYIDHQPGEWQISRNATCTSEGYRYQRCTACRAYLNEETIPVTGHTAGEWQSIAPTCTEAGLEGKCCTTCGELLEGEIVAALGGSHTFGEWEDDGVDITKTCSKCGYVMSGCTVKLSADKTDVKVGDKITVRVTLSEESGLETLTIKANYDSSVLKAVDMRGGDLGATVNVKTGIATMASATTFEAGTICTMTFEAVKAGEANVTFDVVEATDADFANVEVAVNSVKVTVAAEVVEEPTEKPSEPEDPCADGHKWSTWAVEKVATCKEDGLKARNCIVCGEKETEVIPATGKCAYKWIVTKEATATEYGEKVLKCTMCGHVKETQKLAPTNPCANGHNYTSTITVPTCTEQGYTTYTCSTCGDVYTDNYIPALGHNYISTVTPPTCTSMGYTSYTCSTCSDMYRDYNTPVTEHTYTWYTISVVTCETDGVMLGECTVCGATDIKANLKTGHNIVDGVCQNCGITENVENDDTNTDNNENMGNEDNNEDVTDPSENCDCNCHKSGISNFFFKFALFFQKIFGGNKYCGCGVTHY